MTKRKLVLGLFSFVALMTLMACGKATALEKAYFQKMTPSVDVRLTYYYDKKSDKVIKQTTQSTILYSKMQAENKEQAKAKLDPVSQKYQGVKGFKESIQYEDTYLVEKLVVDYRKANIKELSKVEGMAFSTNNPEEFNYVSYKRSEEMLLKGGFTKVKKGNFKKLTVAK